MKPIRLNELKEGDWFCNKGTFRAREVNGETMLSEYKKCACVDRIEKKNEKDNVFIKCWVMVGNNEIYKDEGVGFEADGEFFLLDKKEIGKISKLLIINNL